MKYFTPALLLLICVSGIQQSFSQAILWIEVQPEGDVEINWTTACMNSDGSKIVAGTYLGRIYLSTDFGTTWSEIQPNGNVNGKWIASAMSADGNIIMAASYGQGLWLSINGGATWSTQTFMNLKGWRTISMSSNGNKIIAGANPARLYLSTNTGTDWTEIQPGNLDLDRGWKSSAMSFNGDTIIVGLDNYDVPDERTYLSTDGGTTWTEKIPSGVSSQDWSVLMMSSNGGTILAGAYGQRLWRSTDGGTNWSETQPAGNSNKDWCTGAMSSDGNKIIIGEEGGGGGGRLYRSADGGISWSETGPIGGSISQWNASAISATGVRAIVGAYTYRLFINDSGTPLPVEFVSFIASTKQHSVELQWRTASEIQNYGFEIERRAVDDHHLQGDGHFEWMKTGFVEGSGTTNSPKQYSFTNKHLSAGKYLYRLKQIDRDGKFKYSQAVEVNVGYAPKELSLEQNFPNPFNPATNINYELSAAGQVSLKVYDAVGKEITTLVNEVKGEGSYSVKFDASKLSSGIYFAKLQSRNKIQLKKMIILK
ncbi:MAG: T9SS type A sorting domain-containing protein [Bacteriovoracaceae bacterium]